MPTEFVPVEITQKSDSRELVIKWNDGLITRIKDADLRSACRCGDCRKISAAQGMKENYENTRILEIIPVGSYAVQLCFDDQHDRGIFPWDYLRQLGRTE